jgi:hypothetical protein
MTTKLDEQKVIRLIDEAEDLVNLIGMAMRKGKTHERATIRGVVSQVFDKYPPHATCFRMRKPNGRPHDDNETEDTGGRRRPGRLRAAESVEWPWSSLATDST